MSQDPRTLLGQAESKLSKAKGGWSLFGGREDNYEAAAALFAQAAKAFKDQNLFIDAGRAYEKAAQIKIEKLEDFADFRMFTDRAFEVYSVADPKEAVRCLKVIVDYYTTSDRASDAISYQVKRAEKYETALGDYEGAAMCYQDAAKWAEIRQPHHSNKYWIKVAEMYTRQAAELITNNENPEMVHTKCSAAADIYTRVAHAYAKDALTKYSAPTHLFEAAMCHVATGDVVQVKRDVMAASQVGGGLTSAKDWPFLSDLAEAMETKDLKRFEQDVEIYDSKQREPNALHTALLLAGRRTIGTAATLTEEENEFA